MVLMKHLIIQKIGCKSLFDITTLLRLVNRATRPFGSEHFDGKRHTDFLLPVSYPLPAKSRATAAKNCQEVYPAAV